jgi:small-conductance mechanosensitive channel
MLDALRALVGFGVVVVGLLLTYSWLTFVLRRFPYTRPWGESLRGYLLERLGSIALRIAQAVPDLITVLLIMMLARVAARLVAVTFDAIEKRRLESPWVHPDTAQPTRRIITAILWLVAIAMAYPYLPGSDTDAFKGVSVFAGLMLSLGSSGIINQAMSGLTLTYSRALRAGDVVRIGDAEGTVLQLGTLSTKLKTFRGEEITIPNAVVVGTMTTNYTRHADDGVFMPITVTIGYDTPWRQVEALLLRAAERTPGLRVQPPPRVLQNALNDHSVEYALLVSLEQPNRRTATRHELHANIQDAFNEFGVQIMSPHYESDPERPKVVPRARWFDAPAHLTATEEKFDAT